MIHDRVEVSTDPVLQSEGTGDILIVDDTPINLRLLGQMLVEHGYQVRPVPDGAMALDAVHAKPPDLILLDILMPGMDGYEVCEQLKADAQTRDIPIIFISALDATEDKVKAFKQMGQADRAQMAAEIYINQAGASAEASSLGFDTKAVLAARAHRAAKMYNPKAQVRVVRTPNSKRRW